MGSYREEKLEEWRAICEKATDEELQKLLELHREDPYRMFQAPRREAIEDEINARRSKEVESKLSDVVRSMRRRGER